MANRRMMSKDIIDTDLFLDMSQGSQNLYFHFLLRADDDGFVASPRKIMRMLGIADDDFRVLITKQFVIPFESGVCVIRHWKIHNYIQSDRYKKTQYVEEKALLSENKENVYNMDTECIQDVSTGKDRIGKVRIGKVKKVKDSKLSEHSSQKKEIDSIIEKFKQLSPALSYGNITQRKACKEMLEKYGYDNVLLMVDKVLTSQGIKYAPRATTPYMMWQKIGDFIAYFRGEEGNQNKVMFL